MGQPSFYPPRAKWYSRIFYLGAATRHGLALDRIFLPKDITFPGLIAALLVPGLAVYLRGPRFWGKLVMSACALLFLCFMVGLGYPIGNFAFGLIISIHVSGFTYYCTPFLQEKTALFRIGFTVLVLVGLSLLIYMPLRNFIQAHYLAPMRVGNHVVVVAHFAAADEIHRGDSVAYTVSGYYFSNHGNEGIAGEAGLGLGKVLAVAGDRVEFSRQEVSINGVRQPALLHMPVSGSLVVPENHWFIWPTLAITGNWAVGEDRLSQAMLGLAQVSETRYVGKPLKQWFWRTQTLP
jgi:hypothetical protein